MTTSIEQIPFKGFLVWGICVIFYFYEFLLRTLLGTFQQPIMDDLHLSSFDFSILSSTAYLFVYGIMQIPVGAMITHFGIKRAMLFAAIICTLATLGFSYSYNYPIALLFRFLMGMGSAFGFICVLVAIYDWMPSKNIGLYIGISQFLGTIGPMTAGGPLNTLAQTSVVTWRTIFFILSIIGFFLALLIALFVDKNRKTDRPFIILARSQNLKKELSVIIKEPQVWFIAIFCAFVYFGLEYLSENEGKNFLVAKGFPPGFSSYMITLAWLGFAIGSPLFGYLSDQVKRRRPCLLLSAAITSSSLIFILYLPLSKIEMIISFFSFGLGVGASSVGIAMMGEQFSDDKVSTGLGLNNAITILFVSLIAPCISYLLMLISHGISHSFLDFQRAFIILILLPCLAFTIALFKIKETFARSLKESIFLKVPTI